jgi:hypothetical protein
MQGHPEICGRRACINEILAATPRESTARVMCAMVVMHVDSQESFSDIVKASLLGRYVPRRILKHRSILMGTNSITSKQEKSCI